MNEERDSTRAFVWTTVWSVVFVLLDTSFLPDVFSLVGLAPPTYPSLAWTWAVVVAFVGGERAGAFYGALYGILDDAAFGRAVGPGIATGLFAGLLAGTLSHVVQPSPFTAGGVVFLFSLIRGAFFSSVSSLFSELGVPLSSLFWGVLLPRAFWEAFFAVLLYARFHETLEDFRRTGEGGQEGRGGA
ncbi:hypothetical protein [Brockia lithotrophica]|uniref:Rod shape-determining protein MreD n=1 Tax=Brockia lithotrophica TaxID=933949 RepID=A0A660LBV3_9BACL|nr:hypothetical protein [Brockia lithotrophica]RKQ89100.1 hypothetical protein C7438_0756 [Brockia lithotrophica]